jgi:hypothetical protein
MAHNVMNVDTKEKQAVERKNKHKHKQFKEIKGCLVLRQDKLTSRIAKFNVESNIKLRIIVR